MLNHPRILGLLLSVCVLVLLAACSGSVSSGDAPPPEGLPEIQLSSTAFADQASIPKVHSCDGADISPPLSWSDLPPGVNSLALIVDDPDAPRGTWVHWVVYNLPPDLDNLPQDASGIAGTEGKNDFGNTGYGGPCPPSGSAHRYFFRLYALDSTVQLKEGATKSQLLKAMEGRIVALGTLMGTYQR